MKKLLLLTLMMFSFFSFSQRKSEFNIQRQEIEKLKINQLSQKAKIEKNSDQISLQKKAIDSLESLLLAEQQSNRKLSEELNAKIKTTDNSAKEGFAKMDKNLSSSRIFWIIGLLATALLGYLLYTLLGKKLNTSSSTWEQKLKSDRTALETQIQNTKKSLEEESVKLDSKLVELLESQYKISDEKQVINPTIHNDEIDHSLALKVADEIVRMQKNISKMDSETKGLKPLIKGIERIQNNFVSNGYEMINLINQNYDERMNIDVINFLSDENLPEGSKIISSVIKPQVNYNGVLIQRAQVDVSQN